MFLSIQTLTTVCIVIWHLIIRAPQGFIDVNKQIFELLVRRAGAIHTKCFVSLYALSHMYSQPHTKLQTHTPPLWDWPLALPEIVIINGIHITRCQFTSDSANNPIQKKVPNLIDCLNNVYQMQFVKMRPPDRGFPTHVANPNNVNFSSSIERKILYATLLLHKISTRPIIQPSMCFLVNFK